MSDELTILMVLSMLGFFAFGLFIGWHIRGQVEQPRPQGANGNYRRVQGSESIRMSGTVPAGPIKAPRGGSGTAPPQTSKPDRTEYIPS